MHAEQKRVGIVHGAGYVGGELIRLLAGHPSVELAFATSRTFAGEPVHTAHPALRGQVDLAFSESATPHLGGVDALLVAAEHGQSVHEIPALLADGFDGAIVDLSADFRFADPALYQEWFGYEHPAPELLDAFEYGLVEVSSAAPKQYVANPGCFATGIALALWPLSQHLGEMQASITALTGASGSGAKPSVATHFPTRDGNVRAYKVLDHQHTPEIQQVVGPQVDLKFVPASGPWTRGIWGTAQVTLPANVEAEDVARWYDTAYTESPLVRCTAGQLPELRAVVHTPFCDLGWRVQGGHLVVGFAIDNLLKGAASQAVQNLNRVLDLPETAGLLPGAERPGVWEDGGMGAAIPNSA